MWFFQLHELNVGGVDKWLNDQIQTSWLVPQQLRWDFSPPEFAGCPRRAL